MNHEESQLNTFLTMYADDTIAPDAIAAAMGISIPELVRFSKLPSTLQALHDYREFAKARCTYIASATFERVIRQLSPIATLPAQPSPKDLERARRALDSTRRAADSLLKLHAPPKPTRHSHAAPTPAPTEVLHPVAPLTPPRPTPSPASRLTTTAGTAPSTHQAA
jgi:hypothetical protein